MATYYVGKDGSDANNGLGPDASAVTNKPWLTIGKALGAAGIASGDTVYIGPGTYREVVTVAMTSATAETSVLGDPGNAQGFKTSGGVLISPGLVRWTAYLTNDTTAPNTSDVLDLTSKNYLTFVDIWFQTGASLGQGIDINQSENLTFRRCLFTPGDVSQAIISIAADVDIASNILFDSCVIEVVGGNSGVCEVTLPTSGTADYDCEITFQNCIITSAIGSHVVFVSASGALAFKGGGVKVYNCTLQGGRSFNTASANLATSAGNECLIYNCVCLGQGGINATSAGQILENYNLIMAVSATHTNVTAGANSVYSSGDISQAIMLEVGQSQLWGLTPRSWRTPTTGSPQLGRGTDAGVSLTTDLFGGPRPSGGASASKSWGALERDNTFAKETGTVRTGSNAISITGPGTQDFQLPVDAVSTTVTVYVQWDATYAGTKPQMKVLNGEEAGVTAASTTATGASGSWEQLSLNFTPARAGIVTIRLQSNDTNGAGKMFADDFAVA